MTESSDKEDLKSRIKELMLEIEFTHLKKNWVERIANAGINTRDAQKWAAEIGHVVDEYERSLRYLVDILEERKPERIAERLESWVAYTQDMTVWKLEDATQHIEGFEKYLPLEPDDDEDE